MAILRILLLVFLSTIALNWPDLPLNARLTDAVFLVLAVALAIEVLRRRISLPRLHRIDVLVACYLAGSIIATITSPDPRSSTIELIRHLYLVAIYLAIIAAVRLGYTATIGLGLAMSGAILALVGLALMIVTMVSGMPIPGAGEIMALPYIGNVLRLRAFTASEAMLACVLAIAVPFAIVRASIERAVTWGITAALMIAAAFLTFSHSIAGVLVAALLASRPWLQRKTWPWRLSIATVLAAIVVFNFAATVSIRSIGSGGIRDDSAYHYGVETKRTSIAGVDVEYAVISYFRLKEIAWSAFTSHPILGVGLDRFHALTEAAYVDGRLPNIYRTTDPHSTFLGRMAETGLVGTLPLIALWIGIIITARELMARQLNQALALALFAALCGMLVNTNNADVMNFRFLWVAVALLRALSEPAPAASAAGARR